jgi:hypothetical protein
MSRLVCVFGLLLVAGLSAQARHHHAAPAPPPPFQAGGLQFSIPDVWVAEPSQSPARAAQWLIPSPRDAGTAGSTDGVEVTVFFFGPGVGGSSQENIDAWAGTITAPDGSPAKATPQKRTIAGHHVTEVFFSGTYSQVSPQPGLPPTLKPGYALIGAVVENPGGTIYWRVTGPAAQVMALQPDFDQALASLKPAPAP